MGITLQQFDQLKSRITRRRPTPASVTESLRAAVAHQVVLGIDPSLRGTGYGVLNVEGKGPRVLAQGTLRAHSAWERSRCLVHITQSLRDVIRLHKPTVCIIEGLFFAQNIKTALIMGEARGASLVAAAEAGLEIFEMAPRKVKQAIVGYGAAQKLAVAKMVQRMLNLAEPPASDAADALALALTYAQENRRYSLTPRKRI